MEGRKRVKLTITNNTGLYYKQGFTINRDSLVAHVKPLQEKEHSIYYLSEHALETEFDIDVLSKQEACFATTKKKYKRPIEKPTHSRTLEEVDPKLTDRDIIARDLKYNKSLLTKDQQQKLFDLVYKYRKAFSLRGEIGKSKSFECQLKLKENASLLCKQPYQLSIHEKELMKKEIDKLIKMNVIERVTDPYVPCCVPTKRDKSARLVIDYRHTNQSLKLDHVPFPRISDILNRVAVEKYFSCFDLSDSFFQIPLHIDSRPITTFSPDSQELYQFKRVPQGMSNSPAALCHLTRRLFKEFSFLDNYADDFILHSSEIEKHFAYYEKFFQKVIDDGIKLNLKKCNMVTDECDFLGSTIRNATISPMKRHIQAILKMGQPKDNLSLKGSLDVQIMLNVQSLFLV